MMMNNCDWRWRLRVTCWAVAAAGSVGEAEGQSGRIVYEKTTAFDIEMPPELMDIPEMLMARDGTVFSVYFTPSSSLMVPEDDGPGGNRAILVFPLTDRHVDALMALMTMWHGADENITLQAYIGADSMSAVRVLRSVRKTLRVKGAGMPVEWEVTQNSREHLGFRVVKATSSTGEDLIEAWYAPDIPVSGGPALYGGLPGMILSLSLAGGRTRYHATQIHLDGVEDGAITPPDEGEAVSEEEYRSVISNEVRQMRRAFREMRTLFRGPPQPQCSIRNERSRLVVNCFQRKSTRRLQRGVF